MLTDVKILGCFFHLAKALKTKVDTKRMKNTYENYEYFRTFVKHATAISSLPSDKLIDGFIYISIIQHSFYVVITTRLHCRRGLDDKINDTYIQFRLGTHIYKVRLLIASDIFIFIIIIIIIIIIYFFF